MLLLDFNFLVLLNDRGVALSLDFSFPTYLEVCPLGLYFLQPGVDHLQGLRTSYGVDQQEGVACSNM